MKNNVMNTKKRIVASLMISTALIASCSSDDATGLQETNGTVSSSNVTITPNEVSVFDQGVTDYRLFSTLSLVDKLEVNGENLTVKDKVATFSADFAKLGLADVKDNSEIVIIPFAGSQKLDTVKTKVTVINPITVSTSMLNVKDEDSTVTKAVAGVNKDVEFKYEITQPKDGSINNLLLERKVSKNGTYTTVPNGPFDVEKDSVTFKPSDFTKLDTIYYKVTATSSDNISVSKELSFVIDTKYYGKSAEKELLAKDRYYTLPDLSKSNSENADIEVTNPGDVFNSSISATNANVSFVSVGLTDAEAKKFFDFGDKLEAENVFQTGTAITQISPAKSGEVYVYRKVIQEQGEPDVNTYGLIMIGDIGTNPIKVNLFVKY